MTTLDEVLLKEMLKRVPRGFTPSEAADGVRVDALAALTDDELDLMLDLICEEGKHRGRGSWWWE